MAGTKNEFDRDVVIVGGGASGLSAALFLSRYGLDALVFDRGTSAIEQCYCIENYLGLLGIRPETFLELGREHVRYEGGDVEDDMVVEVARLNASDEGSKDSNSLGGFRVSTQDGRDVTTRFVLAATAYDGDYLAELADGEFHDGGDHPVEADESGRTEIDGLYVAGWLSGGPHQVSIAAGHGGRVAKSLIEDLRKSRGYWDEVAQFWDWRVEVDKYGGDEWEGHVDDWIDGTIPDEEISAERIERVKAEIKEERLDFEISAAEREARLEASRELLREKLFEE
ncbi:FAD-dependent oxidoreductase [Halorussus halophilus]|uniref:FAD-dependent oxidoreductase n=1 Tax=Halorussus halophilus TaxID=2650975 RepID=UPI001300D2D6|nr:FAD-dependent oxidoreductase [Halorussus halophilus]